jgi:hypothetical protein
MRTTGNINTLCDKNSDLLNAKTCGTLKNRVALNGIGIIATTI